MRYLLIASLFLAMRAACNAAPPLLRIEPLGSTALIRKVIYAPRSGQVISVGFDKVVRIWNPASGQQVRTLRGQSGPEYAGSLYALALSPDESHLAVAGRDAPFSHFAVTVGEFDGVVSTRHAIRLFDVNTGQITMSLPGHDATITALAFLPDGSALVSGSYDKTVRLWNLATHAAQVWPQPGEVVDLACSPDGRYVAVACQRALVALWNVKTGKVERTFPHVNAHRLAFSPTQPLLATGGPDRKIHIWNVTTGKEERAAYTQPDAVTCLAFSPDGARLLSGSGESADIKDTVARVWSLDQDTPVQTFTGHRGSTITAASFSPDGALALTGDAGGVIWLWDPVSGERVQRLAGVGAPAARVAWSPDSKRVFWGIYDPDGMPQLTAQYDLERAVVEPAVDAQNAQAGPLTQEGRTLALDNGGKAVLVAGNGPAQRIELEDPNDIIAGPECLAFAPHGEAVVGSDFTLRLYATTGKPHPTRTFQGHDDKVLAVAVSPDGKYLASASTDQTVRIWSLADPGHSIGPFNNVVEPRLSIFRSVSGDWIAWTPQGYYNASALGDRYVGWQVNHGPNSAADFYPADRFAPVFYRPDVIYQLFRTGSLREALQTANRNRTQPPPDTAERDINRDLNKISAPRVQIVSIDGKPPQPGAQTASETVRVRVRVIEGDPREAQIHIVVTQSLRPKDLDEVAAAQNNEWEQQVTLHPGMNRIVAYAATSLGNGLFDEGMIRYLPADPHLTGDHYRTLHLLAIGINAYRNYNPLHHAVADASEIKTLYEAQQGKLFDKVETTLLPDDKADAGSIYHAIDAMLDAAVPGDYLLLFVSAHGTAGVATQYKSAFAPYDYDPMNRPMTLVQWQQVLDKLKAAPCPVVLMLDTCHSGGLGYEIYQGIDLQNDLIRSANNRGLYAILSCLPGEQSWEPNGMDHGVFTEGLIEILKGNKAVRQAGGKVSFEPRKVDHMNYDGTVRFRNARDLDVAVPALLEQVNLGLPQDERYQPQHPKFYSPRAASEELPLAKVK
jgi:WD40 repeat protein